MARTPKHLHDMKRFPNRWMAGIALLLWPCLACGATDDPLPQFPLNAEGSIEILGEGATPLTRAEGMERITEWMQQLGPITAIGLSANPDTGQVTAPCNIVIAEEADEEGFDIEYMSYMITVLCDDGRYAYRIGDVTAGIASYMDLDYDGTYEQVGNDSIVLPDDYVRLLHTAESEREELRDELQSLIGQDLTELSAHQLRRYKQRLSDTTEWYTTIDDYCRMIRNNYMVCLNSLTDTAEALTTLLSHLDDTGNNSDSDNGSGILLDPLP